MSGLLNEVQRILGDVRSEKPATRSKGIEQLDEKLASCRDDLNALILDKRNDLSWPNVFDACKEALFKHASNLHDANEKAFKTLAAKNYLYGNVLEKITKFNIEAGSDTSGKGHFLAKITIFSAFEEGIKMRTVVKHFGDRFMNLLEGGIYSSPSYVRELKINEYSRILSYLFELNVHDDDFLRNRIVKCITKTVGLAKERVQLHVDLVEYLPELINFAQTANAGRKKDIVRLYFLFATELSVNYRHQLCLHMQDILPKLCEYHNEDVFRDDTRKIFFQCVINSLHSLYPKLSVCDFNTFGVPLNEKWPQTMLRLKTIVDMEIRKNSLVRYKTAKLSNDKFCESFIKMSALVMYIVLWDLELRKNDSNGDGDAPKKLPRPSDKMEVLFGLIDKKETTFDDVWFAIYAEVLQLSIVVLNVANYQQALSTVLGILQMYGNVRNLTNVRICVRCLLAKERELLQSQSIQENYLADLWSQMGNHLISVTTTISEEIKEKQLMLQMLIKHDKLNQKMASSLLHNFISNEMLKRNECIATIREIYIRAGQCGQDKASATLEPIISWAYGSSGRCSVTQVIHNIASIDANLLADTFSISIINFLDEQQLQQLCNSPDPGTVPADQNLLAYRHNKQLLCLDKECLAPVKSANQQLHSEHKSPAKNCLYQSNYEFLMRSLNFQSASESQAAAILKNLNSLERLVCTMERLLYYKVFDAVNFTVCPLIKRIGLFLSHIEFQYKANCTEMMDESDLREILRQQIAVLTIFRSNSILLDYLERQPIEMLVEFTGSTLKDHCMRRERSDSAVHATITAHCLHILGALCSLSSHHDESFEYISKITMRWTPSDVIIVTKMLCSCDNISDAAIIWLVDKLKYVFQHHHLDLDVINEIVDHIPTIFHFVHHTEQQLDDMWMALSSLLKIALKKSYTSRLTAKIVRCVGSIALRCPDIYLMENFLVLCKSTAKFITMPTLDVRFATISTLGIVLNTNCVASDPISHSLQHSEFCRELYESIEFKKLAFNDEDDTRNSNSMMVQMLLAIFSLSSFHQEIALKELLYHCARRRLGEAEFVALQNQVPGVDQTMRDRIRPYADILLHKWSSQRWPILKFPYFLCYESKEAFRKAQSSRIMAYSFLYGQPEDIHRHRKSISIEAAMPMIWAFVLPQSCLCAESESQDFREHHLLLSENLQHYKLNPKEVSLNVETLYIVISWLHDPQEMGRLFGASVPCTQIRYWYNLTGESLFKCLNWFICSNSRSSGDDRLQAMSLLQIKHSRILIHLLGLLKTDCFNAIFPSQAIHAFFLYCAIANALYDSALALEGPKTAIPFSYFVRDIWFFVVRFLLHSKCSQVHLCALSFLDLLLNKPGFGSTDFSNHMTEIAKLLISFQMHCDVKAVNEKVVEVVNHILSAHSTQIDIQSILEENSDCQFLQKPNAALQHIDRTDVPSFLRSFLKNPTAERLHDLRIYIAGHKDQLQAHETLLLELIKRLIQMARCAQSKESSNLDAMKCLAQIGPLKLTNISYYFQTDFDSFEESELEPMEKFLVVICEVLEKYLFQFDPKTHDALVAVAIQVANSKPAATILNRIKNLQIFVEKSPESSFLNAHQHIPAIDWLNALKSSQDLDYEPWMCAFVSQVFRACGWQGFDALAASSFPFAETCLQPFIKLLLANKQQQHLESLCQMLDYFFEGFASSTAAAQTQNIFHNKRAIKKCLHICECIRIVNNWSIPIKLENVVRASNHCQAYFLSIMYLELWACGSVKSKFLDDESFQSSAKKAYESIGCLDAIPGFVNPMRSRVDFHGRNNNLSAILLESDHLDSASSQMAVDLMKGNGLWSFAKLQQQEPDYEIFWRLGQWDMPSDQQPQQLKHSTGATINLEQEFKRHHFVALRSIGQREEENTLSAIGSGYECVRRILQDNSMECLQSVYKYLTWLCTLQQAEDFCEIQFGAQLDPGQMSKVFGKWQTELELNYGNFSCKEYIISHQIALFKMAGTRASRRMQDYYKENPMDTYLLKGISECKAAGKLNIASKYIGMLRELPNIKASTKICVQLEDADVNVKMGNHQIAKAILEYVVENQEFIYCPQRVPALRMHGEFLMDCNADSLSSVLKNKFKYSIQLIDDFVLHKDKLSAAYPQSFKWQELEAFARQHRTAAYEAMAKYADREYQQLHEYRHSQDYQTLKDIIEQNRLVAETVSNRESQDKRIISNQMKRYALLDEMELKRIEQNLTEHLCTAVRNHIAYCKLDSGFSSAAIYRIISLWFTNAHNEQLQKCINEEILTVPSYKFICATNQLTGRLNSKNPSLLKILFELLVRCGQDHPHHTFYKLYPLVLARLDGDGSNTERAGIARKIITKICEKNPLADRCSKQLEAVLPAIVTFANEGISENRHQPIAMRLKQFEKVRRHRNLDAMQCPTLELPICPDKEYNNITSICKWTNEISNCGGINAPIRVKCVCSDGQTRAQLIKGKDDLRQDAVMQQVFGIVNQLLKQDSEFIDRKLQLRTYTVTPLSMRSGILEWCPNSMPVAEYLVGQDSKSGAHIKYHPNDWKNVKCRTLLGSHAKSSKEKRFEVFQEICAHVTPVFHYFLLEKFPIPGVWFERRLAYTNSVATTSMVGYVLGLGDRHVQNILIDQQTAEVIHIDFGIAFGQGKISATPETVPFRLTRDFVAPMGICGTKGVFTKSCEATVHILRRYKSVLTTILEVLLYDPLFIWGVLRNRQSSQESSKSEESINLVAQRALLQVQNKLEGREAGTLGDSNVEAQVERLINEATLPDNLCMIFTGWDPYL
ncbi:serine/threonine-protein kinase ATM [Drosophila persimilis]|uniref:serine/threonine-protein kinase ATM n=1 Tax=Drosophila persimilis TaxID=7234 RepID=UPI000F088721|nr:serine/threonine-protein kinase ATM [Drosophila persimilis]